MLNGSQLLPVFIHFQRTIQSFDCQNKQPQTNRSISSEFEIWKNRLLRGSQWNSPNRNPIIFHYYPVFYSSPKSEINNNFPQNINLNFEQRQRALAVRGIESRQRLTAHTTHTHHPCVWSKLDLLENICCEARQAQMHINLRRMNLTFTYNSMCSRHADRWLLIDDQIFSWGRFPSSPAHRAIHAQLMNAKKEQSLVSKCIVENKIKIAFNLLLRAERGEKMRCFSQKNKNRIRIIYSEMMCRWKAGA